MRNLRNAFVAILYWFGGGSFLALFSIDDLGDLAILMFPGVFFLATAVAFDLYFRQTDYGD